MVGVAKAAPFGTPAHHRDDLKRLTAAIAAALTFFGVILLAVVAYAGWSANRAAVQRERTLVENALDQSIIQVLNEQKSIAWWDDAVLNIAGRRLNTEWVDINYGIYLSETYGHNEIYILDDQNAPVYAWSDGENVGAQGYARRAAQFESLVLELRDGVQRYQRNRDQAFVGSQAAYRELLGARLARWGGHILNVDGKPAVVTAITIVPNLEFDLVQGAPYMLVSVVPIDETFVSEIGRSLLMPDLALSPTLPTAWGLAAENFVTDEGVNAGYLSWTPRRPGQTLLTVILPLLALGVLGAGLFTASLFARLKRASIALASREQKAQYEAKHDALSALPNRRFFTEELQLALDRLVEVRDGSHVVVAYIDVDRFKDINDTLGHQAGDALIVAVAGRLERVVEADDFLARFGGDEFAVLRRARTQSEADQLVARLQGAFQEAFDVHGQHMRMSASIGVSSAPAHGMSPEELMRNADIALYRAKAAGRDRAVMFTADMSADVERRREIELDLLTAIENNELTLHYQPLVDCGSSRISGLEALLRWRHPVRGDIPPGVFVPIAEDAGLMPALGAFVLARAFVDAKRWGDLEVSINLSPVQFRHVDLPELLQRLIAEHQIEPSRVVLEVTEGIMMESSDRNRQMLDAIRAMGFKVALDDFGTGYSSLRYLCDFRFDKIKIDRAFVTGIQERKRAMTIIQSVITLGRGLGMSVVAEGVETAAEATIMRLLGVSELQGFYFSRAVPADAVNDLIAAFAGGADAARDEALCARPAPQRVKV